MTARTFVHLSDIHFGQEKGGRRVTNDDVRDRLVDDVAEALKGAKASGIIVTGDIAYSGKKSEYDAAGRWLDRVSAAAGCEPTDVFVAPGNHDIDRDKITEGVRDMLSNVASQGESKLDRYLHAIEDRDRLYDRFTAYRDFAHGYGCYLDDEGGHAGEKTPIELAPGRRIAFLCLNSALISSSRDEQGKLLLGERQRTIPLDAGVERVVLTHHPLHWLQDNADARRFMKQRVRVLLCGHEHLADVTLEQVADQHDFMTINAGATTPTSADGPYTYTYNLLTFDWNAVRDSLHVVVAPRVWQYDRKKFVADANRFDGSPTKLFDLGCPQFRASPRPALTPVAAPASSSPQPPPTIVTDRREDALEADDPFPLLQLNFFRKLNRIQRLQVLVDLGALPEDTDKYPTMGLERQALQRIRTSGKLDDLKSAIDKAGNAAPTKEDAR